MYKSVVFIKSLEGVVQGDIEELRVRLGIVSILNIRRIVELAKIIQG